MVVGDGVVPKSSSQSQSLPPGTGTRAGRWPRGRPGDGAEEGWGWHAGEEVGVGSSSVSQQLR